MKSFARLAVVGVASVALLKLFTTVMLPLLGMLFGLLALTVKLALVAAVAFFLYSILRPDRTPTEAERDVDAEVEEEIEIVVEPSPGRSGE